MNCHTLKKIKHIMHVADTLQPGATSPVKRFTVHTVLFWQPLLGSVGFRVLCTSRSRYMHTGADQKYGNASHTYQRDKQNHDK